MNDSMGSTSRKIGGKKLRSPGENRSLVFKTKSLKVLCASLCSALIIFLLLPVSFAYALTADPMDLGVGARSLGMGKAYVGVAEDSDTLFVNPAGTRHHIFDKTRQHVHQPP